MGKRKRPVDGTDLPGPSKSQDGTATSPSELPAVGSTSSGGAPTSATLPSCLECRKRKVKCDRTMPCGPCTRRNTTELCKWSFSEGSVDPIVLFDAADNDLRSILQRLQAVEIFIESLPHELRAHAPALSTPTRNEAIHPTRLGEILHKASSGHQAEAEYTNHRRNVSYPVAAQNGGKESSASRSEGPASPRRPGLAARKDTEIYGDDEAESAVRTLESLATHGPAQLDSLDNGVAYTSPGLGDVYTREEEAVPSWASVVEQNAFAGQESAYWSMTLHTGVSTTMDPLALRQIAINEIVAIMPNDQELADLVDIFIHKVHWRFMIIHVPAFLAELAQFQHLRAQGRHFEVDPLWLAVCCIVMALALVGRSITDQTSRQDSFSAHTEAQIDDLTRKLQLASMKALHIGDYMGRPRLRTIQAILLSTVFFQQFLQASAGSRQAERMIQWLAIGIRVAQMMGLDKLGSDPAHMPPDDPAWPPGPSSLRRQLALRLWMNLCWADWMSASASTRGYTIDPGRCTSPLIDNLNDDELSSTSYISRPHPPEVITSMAFEHFKWHIANLLRLTYDKVVTNSASFSYDTVIELDSLYDKMFKKLPLLSDDFDTRPGQNEFSQHQRYIALIGGHSRIARLHRPFLSRGYCRNSPYKLSRDRCVSSAQIVVKCHAEIKEMTSHGLFWFTYSHSLNAALVLLLDLFWSIDRGVPALEVQQKHSLILTLQDVFSNYSRISNQNLRKMVAFAHQMITGLLREASDRSNPRSYGRGSAEHGSFADALRRVASFQVNASGSPATVDMSSHAFAAGVLPTAFNNNNHISTNAAAQSADGTANLDFLDFWFAPVAQNSLINPSFDMSFLETEPTSNNDNAPSSQASANFLSHLMGFQSMPGQQ